MRSIAIIAIVLYHLLGNVSIPQAVWGLLQLVGGRLPEGSTKVSIPQAVWGLLQYQTQEATCTICGGFNTASGMRSIAILYSTIYSITFPYVSIPQAVWGLLQLGGRLPEGSTTLFQYRKRYEVYCNPQDVPEEVVSCMFQYRKRYEVYCNTKIFLSESEDARFQYRKRYEVYCNDSCWRGDSCGILVSIPQAVWGLLQ